MLWVCARQPVGKHGPHGELFFFLIKKEPFAKAVEFRPLVPAERRRACALIGLHLMEGENASVSSGSRLPDSGDRWWYGCSQKSPDWDSNVESRTESEGTSSSELREHKVESHALQVIGQNWSGSLPGGWSPREKP